MGKKEISVLGQGGVAGEESTVAGEVRHLGGRERNNADVEWG